MMLSKRYVLFLILTTFAQFNYAAEIENNKIHNVKNPIDYEREIRWNWDFINLAYFKRNKLPKLFPKDFLFGTAICEHQLSGTKDSNWSEWENGIHKNGNPHIARNEKCGVACDFKNRYKDDIQLMKQLGVNSFRFSIDWSYIEPECGKFDESAFQYYEDLCSELIKNGITPVATLHHFVHPIWFEKMGAFEKIWNISFFVSFAKKVFERFSTKIPIWCTINEPGMYLLQGYIRGVTPPGKTNLQLAGTVLCNLLIAHIKVYQALKAMPNGNNVKIGLVHNVLQIEPYHKSNPIEKFISDIFNHMTYKSTLDLFKTGKFHFHIPTQADVSYTNLDAGKTLDFIGLNYYSHVLLNMFNKNGSDAREGDVWTDMQYTIYPEGFYRAIAEVSKLNVPIYITENGIADAKDGEVGDTKNNRRAKWIKEYLYVVSKALADGYDIRGYFYWSLMDNFEWDFGREPRFGLYEVDFETQKRTLRNGSLEFVNIIKNFTEK